MNRKLSVVLLLALVLTGCVNFVYGETTTESAHIQSDGSYTQYSVWLGHTTPGEGVPCDVACNEGTVAGSTNVAEVLTTITYTYTKVITGTDVIDTVILWEGVPPLVGDCACLAWEADDEGYPVSGGDYDVVFAAFKYVYLPLCMKGD